MNNGKYVLAEQVGWDKYDDGAVITTPTTENIVCLGKFECDILNVILANSFEVSLQIISDTYAGEAIENDVVEFCDKLCMLGIVKKEKYE